MWIICKLLNSWGLRREFWGNRKITTTLNVINNRCNNYQRNFSHNGLRSFSSYRWRTHTHKHIEIFAESCYSIFETSRKKKKIIKSSIFFLVILILCCCLRSRAIYFELFIFFHTKWRLMTYHFIKKLQNDVLEFEVNSIRRMAKFRTNNSSDSTFKKLAWTERSV